MLFLIPSISPQPWVSRRENLTERIAKTLRLNKHIWGKNPPEIWHHHVIVHRMAMLEPKTPPWLHNMRHPYRAISSRIVAISGDIVHHQAVAMHLIIIIDPLGRLINKSLEPNNDSPVVLHPPNRHLRSLSNPIKSR